MKILLTGATGFIGGRLAQKLLKRKENIVHAIIRPGTDEGRLRKLKGRGLAFHFSDLTDSENLKNIFRENNFDYVMHLGAIRGSGKDSDDAYMSANLDSAIILAELAQKQNACFIFCSSVGIFGTIPVELPPNERTEKKADNIYYKTKLMAEEQLKTMAEQGLKLVVVRPSVTYGIEDYGFPYMLIDMVAKGIFIKCSGVKIHLVDVDTVADTFIKAMIKGLEHGEIFFAVDEEPVEMNELIDFISMELKGKKYPFYKKLPVFCFRLFESLAQLAGSEPWKARFEFISRSWYYDSDDLKNKLGVRLRKTIPHFKYVVDWYKKVNNC